MAAKPAKTTTKQRPGGVEFAFPPAAGRYQVRISEGAEQRAERDRAQLTTALRELLGSEMPEVTKSQAYGAALTLGMSLMVSELKQLAAVKRRQPVKRLVIQAR